MKSLIARILASAAIEIWKGERGLSKYTAETAESELNLCYHYAAQLQKRFSWLDCDFDVTKPNFDSNRPDIILHHRQTHLLNFLVVEVKRGRYRNDAKYDLKKIRDKWFQPPLRYRFGASVILEERNSTFSVRILQRETPNMLEIISSGQPLEIVAPPKFKSVRRSSLTKLANAIARDDADMEELDAKVFRLYGVH